MNCRRLATFLAIGLVAPVAISSAASSAVDQDLVVSATSGVPGDVVTVSSASCVDEPDGSFVRLLGATLRSGTGADEVLAASGTGFDGLPIELVVPDWLDPAEPAVIEAICYEFDVSIDDEDGELEPIEVPFDAVPFDVLPGVGAPVQSSALSRSSLEAGQAFELTGTGCTLEGSERLAIAEIYAGDVRSGRDLSQVVVTAGDLIDADDFSLPVALINGGTYAGWSESDGSRPVLDEVGEVPTDIPAGTYTVFPYCAATDGEELVRYLLLPPQTIEVTGAAPFDDIELTVAAGMAKAEVSGGSCTVGEVEGELFGFDIDGALDGYLRTSAEAAPVPSPLRPRVEADDAVAPTGVRSIPGDDTTPFSAMPAADGSWTATDTASFDLGFVEAYASCGDTLADGWWYDPQIAAVNVVVVPPSTSTTTTTTTPADVGPPPATAVSGSPNYAG